MPGASSRYHIEHKDAEATSGHDTRNIKQRHTATHAALEGIERHKACWQRVQGIADI